MFLLGFFSVLLLLSFVTVWLIAKPRASEKVISKRLSAIEIVRDQDTEASTGLTPAAPAAGIVSRVSETLQQFRFAEHLALVLRHSGSKTTVGSVMLVSAGLSLLAIFVAHLMGAPLPLVLLAGILGGVARYALLRFQKSRRLNKFVEALPDAIELMARALRAGHSMASAIEVVAEQSPQPLSAEFALCFQQQKFGIPFRDALLQMGDRVPSKDLHFLITAVLVQKETGGDLTDILDRTTRVIRERVRIEGEIRTYTAQGRLTGWILACLPIAMLVLINIITPGYSHILFHDPTGQKLLYAGGTLIILGGLIIRKIVDIKV